MQLLKHIRFYKKCVCCRMKPFFNFFLIKPAAWDRSMPAVLITLTDFSISAFPAEDNFPKFLISHITSVIENSETIYHSLFTELTSCMFYRKIHLSAKQAIIFPRRCSEKLLILFRIDYLWSFRIGVSLYIFFRLLNFG